MPDNVDISAVARSPFAARYLAHYLGLWSMVEHVLDATVHRVADYDLLLHVDEQSMQAAQQGQRPSMYAYDTTPAGVAVIQVSGTLMKAESSLGESTSTIMLRRTIRAAADDPNCKAILLAIDSPGGTTSGTEELANEVFAAAAKKPLAASIDGMGCSAAYWIASQAPCVSCTATAIVGSIGTYAAITDSSAAAAQRGLKVHVVKSAEAKGAGVPGTVVTAPQIAEWQRMIDDTQAVFTTAVARGRGMSDADAAALADGRAHVGAAAKAVGLVDHVESFDAALARLESASPFKQQRQSAAADPAVLAGVFATAPLPPTPAAAGGDSPMSSATTIDPKTLWAQRIAQVQADPIQMAAVARRSGKRVENVSDADVCVLVATADPALHKAYLKASNPGKEHLVA